MRLLKNKIFQDSAKYSAATLFQQLAGMVAGFFVARLLGPSVQGIWQTARLFATYSDLSSLGQGFGMRREAAVAMGRQDETEIRNHQETGLAWNTAMMLLAAVVVVTWSFFIHDQPLLKQGLWGIAAALCLTGPSTFFNFWYKTISRFGALSAAAIAGGMASLLTIPLLLLFGFTGVVAGFVLATAAVCLTQFFVYNEPLRFKFHASAIKSSLKIGIPLWLIMVSGMLFVTIDRIVVITMLGFADMGFYSISTMFFLPLETAVGSLAVVLLPRACKKFGEDASPSNLGRFFIKPLTLVMTCLPGLGAFAAICLPWIITWLLPEYTSGVLPAQILLIGLSFSAASGFCHNVLVAAAKPWLLLTATLISFLVKLVLSIVFIQKGFGLPGIALAASLSMMLRFLIQFGCAAKVTSTPASKIVGVLFVSFIMPIVSILLVYGVYACWSSSLPTAIVLVLAQVLITLVPGITLLKKLI